MNRQQRIKEEWRVAEVDSHGNPRRYELVEHEPQPLTLDNETAAPIVSPLPAQVVRASALVEGDYVNKARAFSIRTWQLSLITGVGLTVGAVALAGTALPFLTLAIWFFSGFLAVWLVAYLADVLISAEGSEFLHTVFLWRFLRHEQIERHRRYGAPQPARPTWWVIGDRILVFALIGWLIVGFVAWLIVRGQ